MGKKLLLINGPSQDPSDRFFGWPTPLLYAVAPSIEATRKGELDVEIVPEIFDPVWYFEGRNDLEIKRDLEDVVERERIDVICASAIYDSVYPTMRLFETAKTVNPEILTIFGGPHFDEVHNLDGFNDVKIRPDLVDIAIAGDGEFALMETLRAVSSGNNLEDVDWSSVEGRAVVNDNNGNIFETSGRAVDLNEVPFMFLGFADWERHRNDFDIFTDEGDILPTAQMMASRGCPYTCNFCSENRFLAYPNSRSVDNIIEEVNLRKSQGFKAIFFDDSTFAAHPRHIELLEALGETGMVFGCLNRFNHLHKSEIVQKYLDAGFRYVYCAIEQFSDGSLKGMQKNQKEKQIEDSMQILNEAGIFVGVSLLWGLPYETEASIRRTLDFTERWVREGAIKLVSESVLSYHPGTSAGFGKAQNGFHRTPPNKGAPFNRFEEGQWYHPEHVNSDYLSRLLDESQKRFGDFMIRNRHSWYYPDRVIVD